MIRDEIVGAIHQALEVAGLPAVDFALEHPTELEHGDYATGIALVLSKQTNRDPKDIATDLARAILIKDYFWLEKVEVAGPGFLNFYLAKEFFVKNLQEIISLGGEYGRNEMGKNFRAIVEYSSPNIAKPFSIGHLRSTIIGDAIARILEFSGYAVIRDNHLGDWGTQFGKLIVAMKRWGDFEKIKKSPEPIKELVGLYVKFHEEAEKNPELEDEARVWFSRLEEGDREARSIWQECVSLSLVEFNQLYERLGIKFDTYHGESFFEDKMGVVLDQIKKSGLGHESEGALLIFYPNDELPPLMILKKDGSSLYALRDLAADYWRGQEYNPSLIINEVGSEQTLYFKQLIKAEELLGWYRPGERVHIGHGLYRFSEGKMSTRKGNVIWLEEVLAEAIKLASGFNSDSLVAEAVGIGALKYNDLKRESSKEIVFDWNDILNLKGNSGPYLQYTYARAKAVLAKAKTSVKDFSAPEKISIVERWLYRFPEEVEKSAIEYSPHYLCTYLYNLASAFNSFYNEQKIIGSQEEEHRLALCLAVSQILANGLTLLGIKTPEKI